MSARLILAIDTATRSSVVVVGRAAPLASSRREVRHRHGSHLLEQIDEVLEQAGATLDDVGGLAVGTGPGSFTGLRVGLATAKTIAYARALPLAGVMSSATLREAAGLPDATIVMAAGAHDHYVAPAGERPRLVAPGELRAAIGPAAAVAVDLPVGLLGEAAARLGARAVEGLPAALLSLARTRLDGGQSDDVAELSPAYVALPRGVRTSAEDLAWSPDLR